VLEQWEDIKKRKNGDKTLNIAKILASFITTVDVQEAARKEGLDFISVEQIEKKISEELKELKEARELEEGVSIEVGDLLFSVINLARFLEIDPAHALFLSMDKFSERFESLKKKGGNLTSISNNKKDKMWEEIKKNERFQ
jgi:tetrapyrrole methylase family protein/MazG family protein